MRNFKKKQLRNSQLEAPQSKKMMWAIVLIGVVFLILLSFNASAFKFDDVKDKIETTKGQNLIIGNKQISYNSIWEIYSPIKITNAFGLGDVLFEGAITEHTNICAEDCYSNIKIYLANDGVLIDDIKFYTLLKNGSRIEQPIENYQFYVNNNLYNIGEKIKAETYSVRLEGKKKPDRTVDWQIKVNGKWLDEWAIWGESSNSTSVYMWNMFGRTLNNQRYFPVSINTSQTPIEMWNFTAQIEVGENELYGSSAIVNNKVYFGGRNNRFYCLNATNGTHIWNVTVGADVDSTPTVVNNIVYFGSTDHNLYALNATDGTQVWNYTSNGALTSITPLVVNDKVYFGSESGKFYCLNATNGTHIWNYTLVTGTSSSPGYYGDVIYVGSFDNKFYAFNATNGSLYWSYTLAGATAWVNTAPTIYKNKVYFGSRNNKYYALNATNGTHIWNYTTGGSIYSSFAIKDNTDIIYAGSYDNNFYALNATNGSLIWSYTTGGDVGSSPVITNNIVIFGSSDYKLYALNATNGTHIWNVTNEAPVYSSPSIINQKIGDNKTTILYYSSNTNVFYALFLQQDTSALIINITSPTGIYGYGGLGEQVLLNWSITGTNLDGCWYEYNNTNVTIGGGIIENYTETPSTYTDIYENYYIAQSFYTNQERILNKIGLNLYKVGSPSSLQVSIRKADENEKPSGDYLVTEIIQPSDIGGSYSYVNISISYTLQANQKYVIQLDSTGSTSGNNIRWGGLINGNYSNGNVSVSDDNGLNWNVLGQDRNFILYSELNCANGTIYFAQADYNQKSLRLWANDTSGNLNYSETNWSYIIFGNSQTFNSTTYETSSENFIINLTYDSSYYSSISANLIYNGTSYSGTKIGTGNDVSFSRTINIPTVATSGTNLPFYWQIALLNASGISYYNSSFNNQTVTKIYLYVCNATLTSPYINFTFKDEINLSYLNAAISSSTFSYWLGDGTINKTFSFSNNTANPSYGFCFSPSHKTLYSSFSLQYSTTDYPQRIYKPSTLTLTNSTTNKVLYLLGSSNGLYVTFQVINEADQVLSGVKVNITREISGENVILGSDTTGAAGTITFWINPDFSHNACFSHASYSIYCLSQAFTNSEYTVQLGSTATSAAKDYSKGISYSVKPIDYYLLNGTAYSFNFTISSSYWALDSFGFNITNGSGYVLGTASSASSSGGTVNLNLNTGQNKTFIMNYYWIIEGNISSASRSWLILDTSGGSWSISNLIDDFVTYLSSGLFGLSIGFNLSFVAFIIIFTSTGILGYKLGLTNYAAIAGIMFSLVWFFDIVLGWLTLPESFGAISHFPTILTGLIFAGFFFKEVTT